MKIDGYSLFFYLDMAQCWEKQLHHRSVLGNVGEDNVTRN